jgi:hypothetical protein
MPAFLSPMKNTYRNTKATKRNYDCTNVVFCQAESIEQARAASPNANWTPCDESEITSRNMSHLWTQGGVRFFGWM